MADGNGTGTPGTEQATEQQKVEFNDAQQAQINKIFDSRFGKIKEKHESETKTIKEQYEARIAELEEAAKKGGKKPADGEADEDTPQRKQVKELIDAEKARTEREKTLREKAEGERKLAQDEVLKTRKMIAMRDAAAKQNFYDLGDVMNLTNSKVEWNDEHKGFVVKENGEVKQNSSLDPMSLEEFYADFAQRRPYLVNGDMVGGTGASESGKGASNVGTVKTKADLKSAKEKSDYIDKFGPEAFEKLPRK